ncbi:Ig-like domain-containing protein [Sanyastnella coralliicola]|uniref:Ig-like domain-containing protein n=1 Tax=Sanyastnella coralliicola TaxID=3069118 RepID=UPI0027B8F640|nr:Ig-like domain-containing protein [Longitalea sp. SCSIO 12813]
MIRCLLLVVLAVAMFSCAKIVPIDGGDRDTEAPRDTLMVPRNLSTNFQGTRIYIEFNEYVTLNDIYNQLVVSPPLETQPEIRIRKKAVIINLQEDLLPNVTYTMNFGTGVVDVNEGNPAENLMYVFSTGPELDSLTLAGEVRDAFTGQPVQGAKVMLYESLEDSMPRTSRPYYFTRTDEEGKYQFSYLKEGEFQLFAIAEEAQNYIYDLPEERIAFLDSTVFPGRPSEAKTLPTLRLSQEIDTTQYVESAVSDSSGFLRVKMYNPFANGVPVSIATVPPQAINVWYEGQDSLFAWTDASYVGERDWVVNAGESSDTLREEGFEYVARNLALRSGMPGAVPADDTLSLRFDLPVERLSPFRVSAKRDSIDIPVEMSESEDPFAVNFDLDLEPGNSYELMLLPEAVIGFDGAKTDTLIWAFDTHDQEHYGLLRLDYVSQGNREGIIELTDKGGSVVRVVKVVGSQQLEFAGLLPGVYRLRIFFDENANGLWDPADFASKTQPEMMLNMPGEISVRSNWEVDLEWIMEN